MESSWCDQQKDPGITHLCLSMSKTINSGLSREPGSRRLCKISGRRADSWGCGVSFCRWGACFPLASYSFQARFLQRSSDRWPPMLPRWLWWRSNAPSLKQGVSLQALHCSFFFNLSQLRCRPPANLGAPEKKEAESWFPHWPWWSCTAGLHPLSNFDLTSWRSPFHVSFQGIPSSIKIHCFVFSLLPSKNKVIFLPEKLMLHPFQCTLGQPGMLLTL